MFYHLSFYFCRLHVAFGFMWLLSHRFGENSFYYFLCLLLSSPNKVTYRTINRWIVQTVQGTSSMFPSLLATGSNATVQLPASGATVHEQHLFSEEGGGECRFLIKPDKPFSPTTRIRGILPRPRVRIPPYSFLYNYFLFFFRRQVLIKVAWGGGGKWIVKQKTRTYCRRLWRACVRCCSGSSAALPSCGPTMPPPRLCVHTSCLCVLY